MGLASVASMADQLTEILDKGTIVIGVPENFPPFGSVGASFEHEGYDVDIAKLIAEDLGVTLELKPITSKQRIPFLTSGTVDLVVSSMGANPERAKSVWFSSAYAPFFSGAFAGPEIKVSLSEDLAGLKAGVTGGTIEDLELSKALPEGAELTRFGDNAATLSAYLAGQVDVLVTGNTVAAKLAAGNPDKALETKFVVRQSPAFVGVKSGEANMLQWVNVFVRHKKLGGVLNDLSIKWLGQELPVLPSL
ncbi:transporter substrate-binding domain-containing protein [Epibacterium ulvae]|uniref:transporter substrate-binding domain-containing protein n=1 Tax=Epibacterium ulvae TaxID=1156985 RepID=UPI002491EA3B|nr:transporter substrate-binding domain-containing protein [Epibacterium ulvae]